MKLNWVHRLSAFVCVLLISGLDANAALNPQFKIDGILGDSTQAQYADDHVEVYGYNHELIAPFDMATGQATGKRQHRPFKFLKRMSRNSSQFANLWTKGQVIRSAEFKVLGNDSNTGETQQIYVYRFTNLRIISIRDWTANTFDPNTAGQPNYQEISFVYQTIEWQSLPDGPVAQDSWAGTQQ